jgi:hypothetical protein
MRGRTARGYYERKSQTPSSWLIWSRVSCVEGPPIVKAEGREKRAKGNRWRAENKGYRGQRAQDRRQTAEGSGQRAEGREQGV